MTAEQNPFEAAFPPQPEPAVERRVPFKDGTEDNWKAPVEASRTPVETALCGASVGFRKVCEHPESAHEGTHCVDCCNGPLMTVGCGHTFVPPSPEAVEPPLTDSDVDPGCMFKDGDGRECHHLEVAHYSGAALESSQELCGDCEHLMSRHDGDYCRDCPSTPEQMAAFDRKHGSQERSETGGGSEVTKLAMQMTARTLMREIDIGSRSRIINALADHESAIARDAEERARTAESDLEIETARRLELKRRAEAAEERATQAEGQREALETALREWRKRGCDGSGTREEPYRCNEGAFCDGSCPATVKVKCPGCPACALSPSTEATPSESTEGQP